MEEENVQRLETVKQTVEGEEYEDPAASEEDVHEEQIISESQPQAIGEFLIITVRCSIIIQSVAVWQKGWIYNQ